MNAPGLTIIVLGCTLSLSGGCRNQPPPPPSEASQPHGEAGSAAGVIVVRLSEDAMARANLQTARVEAAALDAIVPAPAVLEVDAERTASVGPRVTGRISTLMASTGDRVHPGTVLATIDSAEVNIAWADATAARSAEDVARRNYERERSLLERRISAERDVLGAEGDLARATAQRQAAEARLQALGLSGDASKARSGVLALSSPIDGTVVERTSAVGAPVSPADVLFRIADLRSLWLVASVPETRARAVQRGQVVEVALDALPETPVEGRVSYVAETVRPDTRTVDVRVVVPNTSGRLKPGMFARARIRTREPGSGTAAAGLMTIPTIAIQRLAGSAVVFVKTGEREFTARTISVGEASGDRTVVVDGLNPRDIVVTHGSFILKAEAVRGQSAEPR